jgi:hypothetical protein
MSAKTGDKSPLRSMLDSFGGITPDAFQQVCIGGEALIKPIIRRSGFAFNVIGRGDMIVLGRDETGRITDVVTGALTIKSAERLVEYYRLAERRTVGADGICTVRNRLFKSTSQYAVGIPVPLDTLPEYANLQPEFTFPAEMNGLGLIPIRIPTVNCVDGSPDGVSVYAAAAREICKLYQHETRAQDEYDLTAPHLVASRDVQERDIDGRLIEIPKYITPFLDESPADAGLTVWNPKPNQMELEARDDQIKRAIENIIGLKRGFLSKSDVQEFTATEIQSTSTKMAHLIKSLQRIWDDVVQETVRVCGILARMLGMPWDGGEVATSWGNGILYDEQSEYQRLSTMTAQGYIRPEYLVGWQYDMPTDTPEDLAKIREKYMPDVPEDEPGDVV